MEPRLPGECFHFVTAQSLLRARRVSTGALSVSTAEGRGALSQYPRLGGPRVVRRRFAGGGAGFGRAGRSKSVNSGEEDQNGGDELPRRPGRSTCNLTELLAGAQQHARLPSAVRPSGAAHHLAARPRAGALSGADFPPEPEPPLEIRGRRACERVGASTVVEDQFLTVVDEDDLSPPAAVVRGVAAGPLSNIAEAAIAMAAAITDEKNPPPLPMISRRMTTEEEMRMAMPSGSSLSDGGGNNTGDAGGTACSIPEPGELFDNQGLDPETAWELYKWQMGIGLEDPRVAPGATDGGPATHPGMLQRRILEDDERESTVGAHQHAGTLEDHGETAARRILAGLLSSDDDGRVPQRGDEDPQGADEDPQDERRPG